LDASLVVVALATFFSVSLDRMKSTVELYWETNALTLALTASGSGRARRR
jgi:hypothetical protein